MIISIFHHNFLLCLFNYLNHVTVKVKILAKLADFYSPCHLLSGYQRALYQNGHAQFKVHIGVP